jgi:hypothetical protein
MFVCIHVYGLWNECLTGQSLRQFWRNERVYYQRVNKSPRQVPDEATGPRRGKVEPKSVVPEVVDVLIRSPEATPWRRKVKHEHAPEPTSSVESKAATVKKAARDKKKKVNFHATSQDV